MPVVTTKHITRLHGTFMPLLAALIIVLVAAPLARGWPVAASLITSVLLITGIFCVHGHRFTRNLIVLVLIIALAMRWTGHIFGERYALLVSASHLTVAIYLMLLASICVTIVIRRETINHDTVLGAVCGYLLIAYIFAFAYAALEDIVPGSIVDNINKTGYDGAEIGSETPELLYFSFVVLTSVGFGDIIPAGRFARSMTVLEMLAGQLYLAAFVARLVSSMGTANKHTQNET